MKTLLNINNLLSVSILSIVLTGCFGSSNNSTGSTQQPSVSTKIATQSSDSEAGNLAIAADINSDINALFGNPDDKPVALQKGESLKSVFDRLGS